MATYFDSEIIVSGPLLGNGCPRSEAEFTCAASNDDSPSCGNGLQSLVAVRVEPGESRAVLVTGYADSAGPFTLSWHIGFPTPSASPGAPRPPSCLRTGLEAKNITQTLTGTTLGRQGTWGGTCGGIGYGSNAGQAIVTIAIPESAPSGGVLTVSTCNPGTK